MSIFRPPNVSFRKVTSLPTLPMNRVSVASKLAIVLGITATQCFSIAGIASAESASPVVT